MKDSGATSEGYVPKKAALRQRVGAHLPAVVTKRRSTVTVASIVLCCIALVGASLGAMAALGSNAVIPTTSSISLPTSILPILGSLGSLGSTATTVPSASPEGAAPNAWTPGGSLPGQGGFNDVDCVTATWCTAVGATSAGLGVASLSTNGGSTWTSETVPSGIYSLNSVSCVTILICVAVGEGSVMTTPDGGVTWLAGTIPVDATTLTDVTCQVDLACTSVGLVTEEARADGGVILHSLDAGLTWSVTKVPVGLPGLLSVTCQLTVCVAAGAAILTSLDGGTTWQQESTTGGLDLVTSVACSTVLHCVALGPNAAAQFQPNVSAEATSSTDGGTQWAPFSLPAGTGALAHIVCVALNCIAAGSGATPSSSSLIYQTTNGGTSWTLGVAPLGLSAISAITCTLADHCTLVGRSTSQAGGGPEFATTTDGSTWSLTKVTLS